MDNMYINKGIYTYIPNPDPETPSPEPRIPNWSSRVLANNCSGYFPGGDAGGVGGPGNFHLVIAQYPEQLFRLFPGWRDLQFFARYRIPGCLEVSALVQ